MTITINDAIAKELEKKGNGKRIEDLVQEAIVLWLQAQSQAELTAFRGKLKWEGDLDAMRKDQ